jgi:recombination protein RecA
MLGEEGISLEGDVIDLAIEHRILDRTGTWLSYGDIKLGQGRDKARLFLKDNPKLLAELMDKIRAAHGLGAGVRPSSNGQAAQPAEGEE